MSEVDAHMVGSAPTGMELERRSWSPLNLADGADSDDEVDDNQILNVPFDVPAHTEPLQVVTEDQDSQPALERTYDTPNRDAIDRFHSQESDDDLHSTPSKMPSPTRDLQNLSPENSMHAGHTPMPQRRFPTTTTLSQVDDERQDRDRASRERSASARPSAYTNDFTDEYREFDTIMESEGFSMVSLDTLPSARQHTVNSSSKLAKGPLKPFIQRETNGVIRRTTNSLDKQPEAIAPDPRPSPAQHLDTQPQASSQPATKRVPYSPIPSIRPSPESHTPVSQRRQSLRLVKVVRTGIALSRVLSRSNPSTTLKGLVPDYMEPRQRLQEIFGDLNHDSQRVLGAALGLGQVLAIRRKAMELKSPQRRALIEEELHEEALDSPDMEYSRRNVTNTPNQQLDGALDSSPDTMMKQRFAEWQREREAISRTIEMANSSQVIVIDSDVDTPSPARSVDAEYIDDADEDPWMPRQERRGREQQEEAGDNPDNEEEDYDDDDDDPWLPRPDTRQDAEDYDLKGNENQEDDNVDRSPRILQQEKEQQQKKEEQQEMDGEGENYVEGGITYDISRSPRIRKQDEHFQQQGQGEDFNEDEELADAAEDDGYEDIWQEQAKDEGNSSRDSVLESRNDVQSSPWKGGSTPASRGHGTTFSPALWVDGQGKVPYLGKSQIRKLREQEVDISAHAEDTPNRVHYYYGKSSLLGSTQRPSPQRPSPQRVPSSAISQRQKAVERYETESVEQDQPEEPEDYLDFSPEKDLEDQTFQIDPTTRHETEMQRQSYFADNTSIPDIAEALSVHEGSLTPRNPEPAQNVQTSSWVQRFASLTPGWLKAPIQKSNPENKRLSPPSSRENSSRERSQDSSPEEQFEQGSEEEVDLFDQIRQEDAREREESQPSDAESVSSFGQRPAPGPQPSNVPALATPEKEQKAKAPDGLPRLATSGYFSNAHYTLLRRLYRLAKQSPHSFPYYPSSAHTDIIGDYIWTSDNTYGVPITELQFAIVHRFRQELAAQDLRLGGSGWVGWTDADLHRRLVSIIIGEQIREDRKNSFDLRPTRSRPRSILQMG
ncbi:hypothetical protein BDW72DRAFT_181069 [Aspergillus terricola var. indicus]